MLLGWLRKIDNLWVSLRDSSIMHIGMDFNQIADRLSKKGLQEKLDGMHIEINLGDAIFDIGVLPFPG